MRLNILANIVMALLGAIVAALFYMQVVRWDYYHEQSVNNRIRAVPMQAPRGRISDRNGTVLADNRSAYNVAIMPQDTDDIQKLIAYIGGVLHKDPTTLQRSYKRRKHTPFEPVVIAEDIDRAALITLEESRFLYPGLQVQESFERFYPLSEAAGHVVGYVGKIDAITADVMQEYGYTPWSIVGKTGIERSYENILQGAAGGRQIEVNSRGQQVRLLGTKESTKGKDIILSIDTRIQQTAYRLLDGRRGSVVVMDLDSGDVLALANAPAFDPNAFTDKSLSGKIDSYIHDPNSVFINRAVSGQYPPGSVFKVPVAIAALERAAITKNTSFDCPGFLMLGQARFGCAHVHGRQDLLEAIAHSCNVYFYHVGKMVTTPAMGAYAKAFGLGRVTGIDLPDEMSGQIVLPRQKKEKWYTGNTFNFSIGQGDTLATPVQLAVLMGAVATDGVLLKPRVIHAIDGKIIPPPPLTKRPIIRLKDKTWRIVQDGLRQTVQDLEGTAHLLDEFKGITIWGKTGTAQAGRAGDHAWFAGYARSAKSNIVFCVFLEHGGSSANAVALTHDLLKDMQEHGII